LKLNVCILDSQLSKWMYCVYNVVCFFLSVFNIWGIKNDPIFDIGIFSARKINLVGIFFHIKLPFPNYFLINCKKQKKMKEKREFLRKTSFWRNWFCFILLYLKMNHCRDLKFLVNIHKSFYLFFEWNRSKCYTMFLISCSYPD